MDLKKLAGSLLSSDSIDGLSNLTGASNSDVSKVLTKAIPTLLAGAKDQAKGESTSQGFATALSDHAKDDTKDLSKFLGSVDMKDGAKIIAHLLGAGKDDVVADIAQDTGVSQKKTSSILAAAAPLLMSLLGQQTQEEENESGVGGLLGTLLDNVDVGSLLTGLLTSNTSSSASTENTDKKKKKKKTKKEEEKKEESGGLVNALFNLLK